MAKADLTRIERLVAIRDELTGRLGGADDRGAALIAGRLQSVLAEIAELELAGRTKGSVTDELKARRAARLSGAAGDVDSKRDRGKRSS